jgi:putative FmdB family regulatory protein
MPIYEYYCDDCQTQVDVFFRTFAEVDDKNPRCPHCQGTDLERLISQVSVVQGGKAGSDSPAAPAATSPTPENPQALARTMQQASQRSKQDFGSDFKEVAARLERGETATSVEKSLRKRVGEDMGVHCGGMRTQL